MQLVTWIRAQADRVGAVTLVVAGAVSLLIGYSQVSKALLITEQVPYVMSAGLFGLVLVGVGSVLWLSADLRDEWRALKRIEAEMRAARLAGVGEITLTEELPTAVQKPGPARVPSVAEAK
jgi:hypothetical protein